MFLCEPYMSLSCVWWKKYFFNNILAFFIVFDHANAPYTTPLSFLLLHNQAHYVVEEIAPERGVLSYAYHY